MSCRDSQFGLGKLQHVYRVAAHEDVVVDAGRFELACEIDTLRASIFQRLGGGFRFVLIALVGAADDSDPAA